MRCEECRGSGQAPTFRLVASGAAIECRRCGAVSYNPNDVRERYCGRCHAFHTTAPCPSCGGSGFSHCCDGPVGLSCDVIR